MRTLNLFNVTHLTTADLTGSGLSTYPDHYDLMKGVNVSTQGVCTFVITAQNSTATLQGSIDGTNFVDVKSTSRSGTDIAEGYTVAIFPFMRVKTTGTVANAVTKVDIAYP